MACARVLTRSAAQLAASQLLARYGVGPHTAATLLLTPIDNPGRLRSEAALAALCGVSPLQASSGRTCRHRLNRGGDRQANNALWTIALTRMRSDVRTQTMTHGVPPRPARSWLGRGPWIPGGASCAPMCSSASVNDSSKLRSRTPAPRPRCSATPPSGRAWPWECRCARARTSLGDRGSSPARHPEIAQAWSARSRNPRFCVVR